MQIGDSRAYRLRDGLLELLTVDHTVAWLGLLHGWFDHDSAAGPRRPLPPDPLHRPPRRPDPDVLNEPLHPGDVYLLCTDGVADQLTYEQLPDARQPRPTPPRRSADPAQPP